MAKSASRRIPRTLDEWWKTIDDQEKKRLRPDYKRLLSKLNQPRTRDLLWWHDVGSALTHLFKSEKARIVRPRNSKIPKGGSLLELIADKLEPGRDPKKMSTVTLLFKVRKFAEIYTDRKEAKQLAEQVKAGKLTLRHVSFLLEVDEDANTRTREQFRSACLKEGWSANRLNREIQGDRPVLLSRGGRPPKVRTTTNPAVAAREIAILARNWVACHQAYFENPGAPLAQKPAKRDQQLLWELEKALEGLRKVAHRASEGRRILEPIVRDLDSELKARSTAAKQSAGQRRKSRQGKSS